MHSACEFEHSIKMANKTLYEKILTIDFFFLFKFENIKFACKLCVYTHIRSPMF